MPEPIGSVTGQANIALTGKPASLYRSTQDISVFMALLRLTPASSRQTTSAKKRFRLISYAPLEKFKTTHSLQ